MSHFQMTFALLSTSCLLRLTKVRTSTGFEPVTSRYRCDALTNRAMKPLTLGAGHLWVLMSPWRMDVKWYMKYFIYWTADLKSSELWSSQLWTQFKLLRKKPEKVRTSTGFEPVTSRHRCDALTNWAMKALMLGAGHLWVPMSPWRMDVKWYMECFIYWTADLKSSELWSSQLWTQLLKLHSWLRHKWMLHNSTDYWKLMSIS